jgi:uncharacterized protein YkwD
MRIARLAVLFLLSVIPVSVHAVAYLRLDSGIVERRLKQKPADAKARLRMIRQQFRDAGCDPKTSREQTVQGEMLPNVICTLPGSAEGTVVFSAPLEYSEVDETGSGWATLAMLPLLAESLNGSSHRCTYVFVALAGSNTGSGSTAYMAALQEATKKSIVAMIDLEQLGWKPMYGFDGPQQTRNVRIGRSTIAVAMEHDQTPLSQLLLAAADTLKKPRPEVWPDEIPKKDAGAFHRAQIQTLIVTSQNYVALTKFDGTEARVPQKNIDVKAYYATYNLLCVFGLHLDQAFGAERGKATDMVTSEQQMDEHLLAVVNDVRKAAGLAAFTTDARLNDDAKRQAEAFARNKRLSDVKIEERVSKLSMAFSDASETWFVLPNEALKDDALIRESLNEQTRATLLDPRFDLIGVAAVHRGKSYFAVADLISSTRDLSVVEMEQAVLRAIQQARGKNGLPRFAMATQSAQLREAACNMAKQDSLQAGVDAVKGPKVFAFNSANPDRSSWIEQIATFGTAATSKPNEKFTSVRVGVCRASSVENPGGTYWVIAELSSAQ